jgi:hypothetical protein
MGSLRNLRHNTPREVILQTLTLLEPVFEHEFMCLLKHKNGSPQTSFDEEARVSLECKTRLLEGFNTLRELWEQVSGRLRDDPRKDNTLILIGFMADAIIALETRSFTMSSLGRKSECFSREDQVEIGVWGRKAITELRDTINSL